MKSKKGKGNDINIKTIWQMIRSEKGKRYSFIIFYLFFFGFLFIFINVNKLDSSKNNDIIKEINYSLPFQTSNLEQNNYNFKYTVKTNFDELLYKGEKNNNVITIIDDVGSHSFNYKNGVLVGDYKILYKELFDIYQIKRIIKSSKLISETKLNETNEFIYKYSITNGNLDNILENTINELELVNEIVVKTDSNKLIKEITYDLVNYQKEINQDLNEFKVTLSVEE